MKKRFFQCLAASSVLVFFAAMLALAVRGAPGDRGVHQANPAAPSPQVIVTHEDGLVVVHLDPQTQARLGIAESPLKPARERKQLRFPATVLPVENLQSLVSAYDAAVAGSRKAAITAGVAQQEYERLKKLYDDQQNVSARAVQAAAGVYNGDEVDVGLARQNLSIAAATIRQSWGEVIAGWLAHNPGRLGNVLRRDDVLVELTVPSGESFAAPSGIGFSLPAGGRAFARFVSAYPQVDPRVQGAAYLYVTKARPGLAPGINLNADFGVGALTRGVIVPSSAVVWWHGESWAYVATAPGSFVRRQVPTDMPVPGGWFVAHGFKPGASLVTRDAQQVLGVELMPAPSSQPAAGEGDDD
jgi:membrane fusion protein, multidrug efflux system